MGKAVTNLNEPNRTNNFLPFDWEWVLREYPILESVEIEEGTALAPQIVTNDVTGKLTLIGVENANGADFIGILAEEIRSTDVDYATEFKLKSIWIPKSRDSRAYFTVWAGTFTTADVFKTVEYNSDSKTLAVDTAGLWARIVGYINATRWVCSFTLPDTETA